LIPLLEYDVKYQIRNPKEFQATCLNPKCQQKARYGDSALGNCSIERVPAFVPVSGFYNIKT
jgi:hypothetical protein